MIENIGFIILRHVNNELTNKYWIHCYDCIRKFYQENYILIIDDNSNDHYLTKDKILYKTTVINSEYHQRGELLPYYYYLQNKLFETAVVIHDSVFINKYIDFTVDKYKIIWDFQHHWDQIKDETLMIRSFNDDNLLKFYENKSLWEGCFGSMTIITHDFLYNINKKYNLDILLNLILNRVNRSSLERVLACIFQKEHKHNQVLLGDIHKYCPWGITFDQIHNYIHLPIIKVWTSR